LLYGLLFILFNLCSISCQRTLEDTCESETYLNDISALNKNNEINDEEYQALKNYLSIKDSLDNVIGFSYSSILNRIRFNERINNELEEKLEIEKLSKIAFQTRYVTIFFGDTRQDVEAKVKNDADSPFGCFYIRKGEKDYRILLGDCKPNFSYLKGLADKEDRLNYFSITLDIHSASTYKDYYVGETKYAYDKIIEYFETIYGNTDHYYPELGSFNSGYGNLFTVAQWRVGKTTIYVDMSEEKESWDKYGNQSYETKYMVRAAMLNSDNDIITIQNN
jgi:hypothetical protein